MPIPRRKISARGSAPGSARRFFVYILRCSDGSLYAGYTVDLGRRLQRHNSGLGSRYTAARLPVELAYVEEKPDLTSALRREYEIKGLTRKEKLRLCSAQKGVLRHSLR